MIRTFLAAFLCCIFLGKTVGQSNVYSLHPDITVEHVTEIYQTQPVRLVIEPNSGMILYNTRGGEIYQVDLNNPTVPTLLYTSADHGLSGYTVGMAILGNDLFLVGTEISNQMNTSYVKKGTLTTGTDRTWTTVAQTVPYAKPKDFNHRMSGITLSPNGSNIYVCLGSRTDHGEVQDQNGIYPDLREEELNTNILKIPANPSSTIILQNDKAWLSANGYLYAQGVRNHFDMDFNSEGLLFGVENSGTRSDPEEINWLRSGHHYGFPWRMGGNETPMQNTPYDPLTDPLLQWSQIEQYQELFYNDPNYPAPPVGTVFTEGIRNFGPDGDLYIDPVTQTVKDASDEGTFIRSLSPHRSPLGLVFDKDEILTPEFKGDGFLLSFTATDILLDPNDSQDMLHLDLTYNASLDNYDANLTKVVAGFNLPIDAFMDGNVIYVMEYGSSAGRGIWKITMPRTCDLPVYTSTDVLSGNVVKINWEAVDGVEKYKIRYRLSGTSSWTEVSNTINYRFLNVLQANSTYQFQLKSDCGTVNSAWSATNTFTTGTDNCNYPLMTPTVSNLTATTATISWSTSPDDIKYKIRHKIFGGSWVEEFVNVPSRALTALIAGSTYKYKVKTKCSGGWTNWTPKYNFSTPASLEAIAELKEMNQITEQKEIAFNISPNPFSTSTTFTLELQEASSVNIKLIDLSGRIVDVVIPSNTFYEAGKHSIVYESKNLPQGVYVCIVKTDKAQKIMQLVVQDN